MSIVYDKNDSNISFLKCKSYVQPAPIKIPRKNKKPLYKEREIVPIYMELNNKVHIPRRIPTIYNKNVNSDKKYPVSDIPSINFTPRDYQKGVIKKAKKYLKNEKSLLLECCPGFGKTMISLSLIYLINYKCVIFINRESIMKSWYNSAIQLFGDGIVETITSDKKIDKIDYKAKIFICMAQQYQKLEPIIDDIGVTVIDEGHLFCTVNHIPTLLYTKPAYMIWLSATPYRDDNMSDIIPFFIDPKTCISIKSRIPFNMNIIHTNYTSNQSTWANKVKELYNNEERNDMILDITKKSRAKGLKVMILTTTQEHTKKMHDIMKENEEDLGVCSTYYKSDKNVDNYNVVIGTLSKISTGYDEAMACNEFDGVKSSVLILACSIRNISLFTQTIGRVMRSDKPNIFWINDQINAISSQLSGLKKFINESNGKIKNYYYDGKNYKNNFTILSSKIKNISFDVHELEGDRYIESE